MFFLIFASKKKKMKMRTLLRCAESFLHRFAIAKNAANGSASEQQEDNDPF